MGGLHVFLTRLGMVAHTCNPSCLEAYVGGSQSKGLEVWLPV
jgi:hypothetical protein